METKGIKMNISAVVCNRDEQCLVESLQSIDGYVDEIVLVDASRNPVPVGIEDMVQCKFQCFHTAPDIGHQLDIGFTCASYPLILRWDADFFARDGFEEFIDFLHELKGYVAVKTPVKNIIGNTGKTELHAEWYVLTMSKHIMNKKRVYRRAVCLYHQLIQTPKPRFTFFPVPLWYKTYEYDTCVINHRNIKSRERDIERPYQPLWSLLSEEQKQIYGSFEEYVKCMIQQGDEGFAWKFGKIKYK